MYSNNPLNPAKLGLHFLI